MNPFLILLAFFLPLSITAQDSWESINTDRPGEGTDSPFLLPVGAMQLENGLFYQSDKSGSGFENTQFFLPTGLIRLGVLRNLELRAGYSFINQEVTSVDETKREIGFDAFSLGAKIFISEQKGLLPQMALIASFDLPETGSAPFQSSYLAPTIRLLVGHEVNEWLSITTNFDFNWDQQFTEAIIGYTMSFDLSFSNSWGGFAEFYGYLPEISTAEHLFNAGLVYLLNNNLQLDTSAGFAFSEQSPDYFLNLGLSYRFKLY
jgi:hypothetical protein